jgi:Asp/Glu/hydantoin racemase
MTGLPVIGFAEAGLLAAAEKMKSFIVATNGMVWCEMLGELVQRLGLEAQVKGIHSIETVADDPVAIARFLNDLARQAGAEGIVLGGAGLIPTLPQVIAASALPIVDPHREAIRKAVRLAEASLTGKPEGLSGQDTIGLSAALTRALGGHPPMPLRQSK